MEQQASTASTLMSFLPLVLVFVIFYFMLIRPQKKKDKETVLMRSALEIGDEVLTMGGIIGIIVSIKEDTDTVVIETGSDRSKIRILRSAIQTNMTPKNPPATVEKDKKKK